MQKIRRIGLSEKWAHCGAFLCLMIITGWILQECTTFPAYAGSSKQENQIEFSKNLGTRIQEKGGLVGELVPKWTEVGGDISEIAPLAQKVDNYLKTGKLKEAESILDQILAIVTNAPSKPIASQSSPVEVFLGGPYVSPLKPVKLGKIPKNAVIVYHSKRHIYVMDQEGQKVTQITFENPRDWEHVAVSYDRRYIIANDQLPNPSGAGGGFSRLWLFDLEKGTESQLVPEFITAGNGGVSWDKSGFIYFAAKEKDVVANPKTRRDFIANASANDVYKIKFDGTGLKRLTNTPNRGEADVSVSDDGTLVTFGVLVINPPNDYSEIGIINSDGTNPRVILKGGVPGINTVHDPEFSLDNRKVFFSRVNASVPPNFPKIREANTAHDLYSVNFDGTGLKRLTKPGPISIIPNVKGTLIVYIELNDKENYSGASIVPIDGVDQSQKRIKRDANSPKWIP